MTYTKSVNRLPTGGVEVRIVGDDTETRAYEIFHPWPLESDEDVFKRAHKWTDALIKVLKKHECVKTSA